MLAIFVPGAHPWGMMNFECLETLGFNLARSTRQKKGKSDAICPGIEICQSGSRRASSIAWVH